MRACGTLIRLNIEDLLPSSTRYSSMLEGIAVIK